MNDVGLYLQELEGALHVRGPRRRRFLAECREHLADATAAYGPVEAIRRFGPSSDVARAFETEVAAGRARQAALLNAVALLAVAASTLMMVNAADGGPSAPRAWAVVFFISAQTAAAAMALALLRAAAMRYEAASVAEAALLCRRNWVALGFAGLTMFSAGAAVPGELPAWRILLGPAFALISGAATLRAGHLARRHRVAGRHPIHSPLSDLAVLARGVAPAWTERPGLLLAPALLLSTTAAFWWCYLDEHGTVAGAAEAAGIEAVSLLAGFVVLGTALGISARRTAPR